MHLLWSFLLLCSTVSLTEAASFGIRETTAPPTLNDNGVPQDDIDKWVHVAGAIRLETPSTLSKGELIFASKQAFAEMVSVAGSKTQAKNKYPSTIVAMLVERDNAPTEIYFSSSVKGSGKDMVYSGRFDDPRTIGSPEAMMKAHFGDQRHRYGGSCGEFGALREYDRLNRPAGSREFKWPDRTKTTFVAWFKVKVVPPCTAGDCPDEEQFGCADFLKVTNFKNVITEGEPDGNTWSHWKFSQVHPTQDRVPVVQDAPAMDTSCSTTSNPPLPGNSKRSIKSKSCTLPSKAPKAATTGGKTMGGNKSNVQKKTDARNSVQKNVTNKTAKKKTDTRHNLQNKNVGPAAVRGSKSKTSPPKTAKGQKNMGFTRRRSIKMQK
ncbi:hypothetical protein MCOR17_009077 [Pyricularia oryzae]|uniref:Uncharacterized protein n=1 Tax=Pyricularia oryzae TaxID=318829 RepID=A0A4P7MTA5_PYROR|nr:hypothetical protein MCOR17_009077 [Pyricularia oryzae]QBZ53448.1 hypothetical protein PoMZ_09126 [Pyricularia oryzae]